MLAIKLQRIGKKGQPSFRVVVSEKRQKMGAPPVEDLGSYSVFTKKAVLDPKRVAYWLGVGAEPTVTVHNLLVREKLVKSPKKAVKIKHKPQEAGAPEVAAAPAAEAKVEPAAVTEAEPEAKEKEAEGTPAA